MVPPFVPYEVEAAMGIVDSQRPFSCSVQDDLWGHPRFRSLRNTVPTTQAPPVPGSLHDSLLPVCHLLLLVAPRAHLPCIQNL